MSARRADPRTEYRFDEVVFLSAQGLGLEEIAWRLGIKRGTLERWLRDHGHNDTLDVLLSRDEPAAYHRNRHLRVADTSDAKLPVGLLTSQQVMAHAGITYRQLDYWTRTGIIAPYTPATPGSGSTRHYERDEADVALTIRLLLDAGLEPRHAADLARQMLAGETPRIGMFRLVPIPGESA